MSRVKCFINGTAKQMLAARVVLAGDRAIDTGRFSYPGNVSVKQDDAILCLSDVIDLSNLEAVWHFEGHVKDESGNTRNLTINGSLPYATGKYGKAITSDGADANFLSLTEISLTGAFTLIFWTKRTDSTTIDTILGRNADTVASYSKIAFQTNNQLLIRLVENTAGATVDVGYTAGLNGAFNQIVIKRDTSNVIKIKINNGAWTTHSTQSGTFKFDRILRNKDNGEGWAGAIDTTYVFSREANDDELSNVYNRKFNVATAQFGGTVKEVSDKVTPREVTAQSYGYQLANIRVQNVVFSSQSPEAIISSLVTSNTSLIFIDNSTASGITITKFVADGVLVENLADLAKVYGKTFRTDALAHFILEDSSARVLSETFTNGDNCIITEKGSTKDTELVNDITVVSPLLRFTKIQLFSGNGSTTVFTLTDNPIDVRVMISSVEKVPGVDYSVDIEAKTITFTVAPPSAANNISVEYAYESPIYVRKQSATSIAAHGRKDKQLVVPWVRNEADGIRFAATYLSAFKDVRKNYQVLIPVLFNDIEENSVVRIVDAVSGISATVIVKQIEHTYPQYKTLLDVGEFNFDTFEAERFVIEKLHDLESIVVSVKNPAKYASVDENLALVDVVSASTTATSVSESITITDVVAATAYTPPYKWYTNTPETPPFKWGLAIWGN